jgi:release factor glutamine methyltransferase
VQCDLDTGLRGRADVIVSNPPYVPDQTARTLPADVVRYEPAAALFGGTDGLAVLRRLFATLADRLATGGTFIVEFGFGQEDAVTELAAAHGWVVAGLVRDLQGIPRTAVLRR